MQDGTRGDPERTTGLLISTQQQECGVCTSKRSVMGEQTERRLKHEEATQRRRKDAVCCGGGVCVCVGGVMAGK